MNAQLSAIPLKIPEAKLLREPLIQTLTNKLIVVQVWIGRIHAVDLVFLPRAEILAGVEAPDSFQQSLPSQHFVEAGDATGEVIRRVKESRISIGDFNISSQQLFRDTFRARGRLLAVAKQLDRSSRPYRPVAKQPALHADFSQLAID